MDDFIKKTFERLRASKDRRDSYVSARVDIMIPFQIRSLRKQFGLEQDDLAKLGGMVPARISRLEKVGNRASIETLERIANALDVALMVKFVPFTELAQWSEDFDPDHFSVPTFSMELECSEEPAP